MSYTPKRKNNAHLILPLSLFIAAFVVFLTSIIVGRGSVFLQAAAVILLIPGIDLTSRYTLSEHSYTMTDEDGYPANSLIITSGKGKRRVNEYIPLASCTALTGPHAEIPKELRGRRRYNYANTLLTPEFYLLAFDDPSTGDEAYAILEADEAFATAIYAAISR